MSNAYNHPFNIHYKISIFNAELGFK